MHSLVQDEEISLKGQNTLSVILTNIPIEKVEFSCFTQMDTFICGIIEWAYSFTPINLP